MLAPNTKQPVEKIIQAVSLAFAKDYPEISALTCFTWNESKAMHAGNVIENPKTTTSKPRTHFMRASPASASAFRYTIHLEPAQIEHLAPLMAMSFEMACEFALWHELGHAVHEHSHPPHPWDNLAGGSRILEIFADIFACHRMLEKHNLDVVEKLKSIADFRLITSLTIESDSHFTMAEIDAFCEREPSSCTPHAQASKAYKPIARFRKFDVLYTQEAQRLFLAVQRSKAYPEKILSDFTNRYHLDAEYHPHVVAFAALSGFPCPDMEDLKAAITTSLLSPQEILAASDNQFPGIRQHVAKETIGIKDRFARACLGNDPIFIAQTAERYFALRFLKDVQSVFIPATRERLPGSHPG